MRTPSGASPGSPAAPASAPPPRPALMPAARSRQARSVPAGHPPSAMNRFLQTATRTSSTPITAIIPTMPRPSAVDPILAFPHMLLRQAAAPAPEPRPVWSRRNNVDAVASPAIMTAALHGNPRPKLVVPINASLEHQLLLSSLRRNVLVSHLNGKAPTMAASHPYAVQRGQLPDGSPPSCGCSVHSATAKTPLIPSRLLPNLV